jgi:PPOX class probable F420-dependent enzyme
MEFPYTFLDLLKDETKAFLYLATTMADGSPQVTPVWFGWDGEHILINTAQGRVKDRNMQARPKVAMVIQNPAEPYRYLQIRGVIAERTTEGSLDLINALSLKYANKPWEIVPWQVRVTYKIKPLHYDQQ